MVRVDANVEPMPTMATNTPKPSNLFTWFLPKGDFDGAVPKSSIDIYAAISLEETIVTFVKVNLSSITSVGVRV